MTSCERNLADAHELPQDAGLAVAERFYRASVDELFSGIDGLRARHAAGLVGEGSECFGFDDELSRDHDFGPGFCIWLPRADFEAAGAALQQRYDALAARGFEGRPPRIETNPTTTHQRIGVLCIDDFYARLLGTHTLPHTIDEWRSIPEANLAAATNGRVFRDELGRFSDIRKHLAAYYPDDIRLRKIACACMHAAQAGQYNFIRQSMRAEDVAALQALAAFMEAIEQVAHALERRYLPFYKWAHRNMRELGSLGCDLAGMLDDLLSVYQLKGGVAAAGMVEAICARIADELRTRKISDAQDTFLVPHGIAVNTHIRDDAYRRTNLMEV